MDKVQKPSNAALNLHNNALDMSTRSSVAAVVVLQSKMTCTLSKDKGCNGARKSLLFLLTLGVISAGKYSGEDNASF